MKTRPSPKYGAVPLTAFLLLAAAGLSFGQSGSPRRVWGGSAGGLLPAGEFARRVDQPAFGGGAFYAWRIWSAPLFFGAEVNGHIYGYSLRTSEYETYNSIVQVLGFARIQPWTGSVVPYLEALAGASYLSTEMEYPGDPYDEVETEILFHDITWAAGIGAGLSIFVGRGARDPERNGRGTYLDIKVRRMVGGPADYLVESWDGTLYQERSGVGFFTIHLGLSFFF
jgi:hypothetical protein